MSCLSLVWLRDLFIWLVIIAACVAIINLLVPLLAGILGSWGGIVVQAINIVLWAIVAIAVIYVIFSLLSCLMGGGVSLMPPMPHR